MGNAARPLSGEEARALPAELGQRQVIRGQAWSTPAPTWTHQRLVLALARRLAEHLDQKQLGEVLTAPAILVFGADTAVEPDLFVLPASAGERPERVDDVSRIPLVVEVLSRATARLDKWNKRRLYQEKGIGEYWIVDPDARLVERWRPADTRSTIVHETLSWAAAPGHQPFTLELPAFFGPCRDDELPTPGSAAAALPIDAARRSWTAREVRQLIADAPLMTPRYELVDGELLVTSSPSLQHQGCVGQLLVALQKYLRDGPLGSVLMSPFDVELEPESLVQPDVFVLPEAESRRLMKDELPARELLVAIEILSADSAHHDRVTKRPLYQRHVSEYWIVDLGARAIERWRPGDERADLVTEILEWHPAGAAEPFRLDLPKMFARIFHDE